MALLVFGVCCPLIPINILYSNQSHDIDSRSVFVNYAFYGLFLGLVTFVVTSLVCDLIAKARAFLYQYEDRNP